VSDIIPKTIAAGVNFTARASLTAYAGLEWTLVLLMRGPAAINAEAERDLSAHVWDIKGVDTAAWAPGEYAYSVRATNGADVVEVESGRLRIKPDVSAAVAGDELRSANRIALDNIRAVIQNRATVDQRSYEIAGRKLERMSSKELFAFENYFIEAVRREEGKSVWGRQVKFVAGGCD
jgi:hypothetical protein